jgi:hypothetical protein
VAESFNPHDMISPPFKTCPSCGQEEFGVHLISRNQYMRRCRDCWHKQYFSLPKLQKKIIYLDQFVVSNLMKLDNPGLQRNDRLTRETFWKDLRGLLLQLREMQLICCPNSGSHEAESKISPFNEELKRTYEALSGGIGFKSFNHISSDEIRELGSAWSENREPQFSFDPRNALSRDPNEWAERYYIVFDDNPFVVPAEIQDARDRIESEISRLFRDVWAKEKRTFGYWYDLERKGYQGHLSKAFVKAQQDRLHAVLSFRPGLEMSLEDACQMILSPAEALHEGLKHIMRFPRQGGERSVEERNRLEKSFGDANRISEAPFVKLQSLMYASLAMRAAGGQKEVPNEGTNTDIETVAHLLPFCDAMFMDNGCRSLLLDVPKEMRPTDASKAFSPNCKDEFMAYLRSILRGATEDHVAALREVYGDD